jgi:hypothetical protein
MRSDDVRRRVDGGGAEAGQAADSSQVHRAHVTGRVGLALILISVWLA